MLPGVASEVPSGDQHQAHFRSAVFASQSRKIHVFGDRNTGQGVLHDPDGSHAPGNEPVFDTRKQVTFGIVSIQYSRRAQQPGTIFLVTRSSDSDARQQVDLFALGKTAKSITD